MFVVAIVVVVVVVVVVDQLSQGDVRPGGSLRKTAANTRWCIAAKPSPAGAPGETVTPHGAGLEPRPA